MTYRTEQIEIINAILLGFIEAHGGRTQSDEEVESRLYESRSALFNIPTPSGNRFVDDWDTLLKIASEYIADRGEPVITSDWKITWPKEAKGTRSFQELVRPFSLNMNDDQFTSLTKRLRNNFNKNKDELLRTVYFRLSTNETAGTSIADLMIDFLDEFGIRMTLPRRIRLGVKRKPMER